jgi:hypothetical protein
MELSRRAFVASTAAFAVPRRELSVRSSLEESRIGFHRAGGLPASCVRPGWRSQLIESSAGYEPEDLTWLARHGIQLGAPVRIAGPAWVRYTWPTHALIRDFGQACPVTGGQVIARLADLPVAVRRGPFVVLGSPLGPHLYAGDPAARDLFEAFLRS